MQEALLDVGKPPYDLEKGYSRHVIVEGDQGIIIRLQKPSIINTIKLLLWDLDNRSYSYKIEYSMNNKDWTCIVDYSGYFCRSSQLIHFQPIVTKYVLFTIMALLFVFLIFKPKWRMLSWIK